MQLTRQARRASKRIANRPHLLTALTGAAKNFRHVTMFCRSCQRTQLMVGPDGEDVQREITRTGWKQFGLVKTDPKDASEQQIGKCPVCVGLGN